MFENRDFLSEDGVLVIPMGVPLPVELDGVVVAEGTLYQRLAPLCSQGGALSVAPLSGAELVALTTAWDTLVDASHVYTFSGLPGARPDVTFDHACRVLGIRVLDWAELSAEVAEKVLERQRASGAPPKEGAAGVNPIPDAPALPIESVPASGGKPVYGQRARGSQGVASATPRIPEPTDEGDDEFAP